MYRELHYEPGKPKETGEGIQHEHDILLDDTILLMHKQYCLLKE